MQTQSLQVQNATPRNATSTSGKPPKCKPQKWKVLQMQPQQMHRDANATPMQTPGGKSNCLSRPAKANCPTEFSWKWEYWFVKLECYILATVRRQKRREKGHEMPQSLQNATFLLNTGGVWQGANAAPLITTTKNDGNDKKSLYHHSKKLPAHTIKSFIATSTPFKSQWWKAM